MSETTYNLKESEGKPMDVDIIGGFPFADPNCKGCGKPLELENACITDGCPCNTPLGVNSMNETRWRLLMRLQQEQTQKIERLYKPAASKFGHLFCWCVENLQPFPPMDGEWVEDVKTKLSALAAAQKRIEELERERDEARTASDRFHKDLTVAMRLVGEWAKVSESLSMLLNVQDDSSPSFVANLWREAIADIRREAAGLRNETADANKARIAAESRLSALTEENERLAKLTEWQPIETAPKDGTKILVIKEYFDPYRKLPMSWHDIAYWTTHNSGGWVSATAGTPTHWRPLPPPPADRGAR